MQGNVMHGKKTISGLSMILGDPKTRREVVANIEADAELHQHFRKLPERMQEELIAFCMGSKGLKMTYDPFFKFIFNPSTKPERLSELLSLILEDEVEVVNVIPNESERFTEEGSLLITDILVRLCDGAYANVEIQKIGYSFPGERCACYSSDLLLRQLTRMKKQAKEAGRAFAYGDLKKVYTIVLIEESTAIYWKHQDYYIHRGKQTFDTGLEIDLLQEFILIPLDIFKNMPHNTISRLEAWLYFIGSDSPKDICRVVEAYPDFKELYKELIGLRYDMKGLIGMFDYYRQLLKEADRNTVEIMLEERQKAYKEAEAKLEATENKLEVAENKLEVAENKLEATEQELKAKELLIADLQEQIRKMKQG